MVIVFIPTFLITPIMLRLSAYLTRLHVINLFPMVVYGVRDKWEGSPFPKISFSLAPSLRHCSSARHENCDNQSHQYSQH